MKILYIFRSSYDAAYILSRLGQKNIAQAAILESGNKAKFKKIKRSFQKSNIFRYPAVFVDLLSLLIYSFVMERGIKKRLGVAKYPKNIVKLVVDDANDKKCIEYIQKYKPDIIFIYGTAILGKTFLSSVHSTILNIHSGILPYYRNVHSDFWAYIKRDYKNIGVSIFFLDAGIDTGSIALQKRITYTKKDHLIDIKVKNLTMIPNLIELVIKKYRARTLKRKIQSISDAGFYPTPTFRDFFKLLRDNL